MLRNRDTSLPIGNGDELTARTEFLSVGPNWCGFSALFRGAVQVDRASDAFELDKRARCDLLGEQNADGALQIQLGTLRWQSSKVD